MTGRARGDYRRSRMVQRGPRMAAQYGGDVVSDTFFGGFHNFLSIYNLVLTGRILLSWFPQFARNPVFEPLFTVTNPFFNIFRGLIPPIGGIDLSPLPAFFLLSFLTNATETMGAELPNKKNKVIPGSKPKKTNPLLALRCAPFNLPRLTLPSLGHTQTSRQ